MEHDGAGGAAPGHDTDHLFFPVFRLDPFLGITMLGDQIVDVFGQVLGTKGVPDKPVGLFRIRDETGRRRQGQGARLVTHQGIHPFFFQKPFCLFP